MPTARKGDSAQAAIALVEGALQASKPRPVKTEPPTEAVAGGLTARDALARAAPKGRARGKDGAAARLPFGVTTIARRLPRIGPAGQRCSFEGAPRETTRRARRAQGGEPGLTRITS